MHTHARFGRRLLAGLVALVCVGLAGPAAAEYDQDPDCSDQLEQIPRDGATVDVANPWVTVSGNLAYSGLADVEAEDVRVQGAQSAELESLEADSHVGIGLEGPLDETVRWSVGEAPEASFDVRADAGVDESAPTIGDGEVEASLELEVYEDFPVMFRHWELSFPAGEDDRTDASDMRYLIEFTPEAGEQRADTVLVTPGPEAVDDGRVTVELGGRTDLCNHAEPGVAVTDETTMEVRAVDLAGNVSEEPAVGTFEGMSQQKLAEAHEEMNRVVERVEEQADDEQTTEEIAEGIEEDEEGDEGCSVAGGGGGPLGVVLVLVGLVGVRWW